MPNITTSSMADTIFTMYEQRLLPRALPRLVHGRWGREATWDKHGDYSIRRFESMSAVTSSLGEGSTPAEGAAPTITTITLDPVYYGSWVELTDEVQLVSFDPILSEVSSLLGEQCGLSMDTLIRNALISGATAAYSGGVSAIGSLDYPEHKIGYKDIVQQISALMAANAIHAENGKFMVVIHPHTFATLMQDPVFVNLFTQETDAAAIRSGKMGSLMQCDFFISSNAYEYADAGAGGTTDVYSALFIGNDAFATAGFTGLKPKMVDMAGTDDYTMTGKQVKPLQVIIKPLGSGGTEDPLDQRGSAGWKATLDTEILQSSWIRNLYHVNDFSDS